MAIYLDSANLDEARLAKNLGWIYGVMTNPSLMAKAGLEPEVVLQGLVAASLKSIEEAVGAFLAGAQHLTFPFDLLKSLLVHPLSVKRLNNLLQQVLAFA